jgi:DNA-binding NarL/FixJ family response regulator
MGATRVVVADDHGLTLSAVSDSLSVNGFVVEARAATAKQAVDAVVKYQPDALVVDLDLGPGPSGLHVAASLRRRFPSLGVVVLSGYADPRLLSTSMPDAPHGTVYLVKHQIADVGSVVEAVRDSIVRAQSGAAASVPEVDLTRSQIAVLDLVAQGLTNGAIAERLFISEDAVSKHVNRIAKRLDVSRHPDTNTRGTLASRYFELVGNRRSL